MKKWKKYKLDEFIEINPLVKLSPNQSYSFIEMKDLDNGQKYAYPSRERVLTGGARFEEGDTLFARITPCLENGKICQAKGLNNQQGFGSTEFLIFRNINNISDLNFVYYLARWDEVRRFAELNMVGTSGRQRVPKDIFGNLELELPEKVSTQTSIASILSSLDDKIEINKNINNTLEKVGKALFANYFISDIDPSNLPEGWITGKLGDLSRNLRISTNPQGQNIQTKYLGLEHLPRKSLSIYEWGTSDGLESQKFIFKEDQILFGKLRPYFHKVIIAPFDGICSTDILVIEPKESYMLAFCVFHYFSNELVNYSNMFSDGTRMPRTNWETLANFEIPIPNKELLMKFNSELLPLLLKIKQNIFENISISELRNLLLPKLMSGEIEVL